LVLAKDKVTHCYFTLCLNYFCTLKGSWPWPWIGSYCIPSCITHRPLPTCQISL